VPRLREQGTSCSLCSLSAPRSQLDCRRRPTRARGNGLVYFAPCIPPFSTIDSPSHALDNLHLRFRADTRQLQHLCLTPFNLHEARVRRASGFLLAAFSNARPQTSVRSTLLTKGAPPKKH
jgi:hypothetical protein